MVNLNLYTRHESFEMPLKFIRGGNSKVLAYYIHTHVITLYNANDCVPLAFSMLGPHLML